MQRAATFRGAQPQPTGTSISVQTYLSLLVTYMHAGSTRTQAHHRIEAAYGFARIVLPYTAEDASSSILYPGLSIWSNILRLTKPASVDSGANTYSMHLDYYGPLADRVSYGPLPYWRNATLTINLNAPATLSFDYPVAGRYSEYLHQPHSITLRDSDGYRIQRFAIKGVSRNVQRTADGEFYVHVESADSLDQWNDEYVASYHAYGTIREHAEYLIANYQTPGREIPVGTIWDGLDTDTLEADFQNQRLLDCINSLYKLSGYLGQYCVTPARTFEWRERLGTNYEEIRFGYNLLSVQRATDETNFATKLYVYGGGLSQEIRPYVVVAWNTYDYGTIIKSVTFENITDSATLLYAAYQIILSCSTPVYTYTVDGIDLKEAAGGRSITIGSRCHIYDDVTGEDTYADCVKITKRLDSPVEEQYEFGSRAQDLGGLVADIQKRIWRQETRRFTNEIQDALTTGAIDTTPQVQNAINTGDITVTSQVQNAIDAGNISTVSQIQSAINAGTISTASQVQSAINAGTITVVSQVQSAVNAGTISLATRVQADLDSGAVVPKWVEYS
jgi:phage minor structural protein